MDHCILKMAGILTATCKFNLNVCLSPVDSLEAQWSHITPYHQGSFNCIIYFLLRQIRCITENPVSEEQRVNIIQAVKETHLVKYKAISFPIKPETSLTCKLNVSLAILEFQKVFGIPLHQAYHIWAVPLFFLFLCLIFQLQSGGKTSAFL